MNASSIDIKDILEDKSSLDLEFKTNLFVGREPAKPNDCVTIFDTPGAPPQLTLDDADYYYPSIQIRVRNTDYRVGWNLIHDIMILLHGMVNKEQNETLYTLIYCSSGPAMLDWDENNRVRFIINFNLQRR